MVEAILEDVSNFMAGYSVYFSFQPHKRNAVKLSRCFCPRDVITGPWPVHTPLTALQSTHDVKCPWCYKTNQIGGRKINVQPSSNSSKSSYEISGKKIQFSNSLFTLKIAKLQMIFKIVLSSIRMESMYQGKKKDRLFVCLLVSSDIVFLLGT